jgi:hypothetical protein
MRRFNKFLQGEIGMDGKSVTEESKMDVDKPQIIDDRIEVVKTALASILKDQNWEFPQGVAISPAQAKDLKGTKSFGTNVLIRLYHS